MDDRSTPARDASTSGSGTSLATWPGRGCLGGEGAQGHGTLRLTLSSEPDLLTAHTGHSVDVAQHWETDEASAGEEAAGL